jgi:MFS family permease
MLLGIGIALTMSPMTSAAMNAVPVEKAGIASGVLSMFRMVGGSLGVAVTGAIFQGSVGASFAEASPQQFVEALAHAMEVCAVVAVVGAAIGTAAIRARPAARFTPAEEEEVLAMSPDPAGQVEAASQL